MTPCRSGLRCWWKSLTALAAVSLAVGASRATEWERLPDLPEPNGGFVTGAVGDAVVVAGGTNWTDGKKHWLRAVHVFEPARRAWRELAVLPRPLAYGIAGETPTGLVLAGGSTGQAPASGRIDLSPDLTVSERTDGLTTPAVLAAGGVVGGELIAVGGTDDAANGAGFCRRVIALTLRTGANRTLPDFPGPPLASAAAAVVGDEVFVFAGGTWDASKQDVANQTGAWAYSASRNSWRPLRPFPAARRGIAAVALDGRRILLAGGYGRDDEGFSDEVWIYDVVRDEYRRAGTLPYKAMTTLVRAGGFVYCLGGEDQDRHRTAAVHRRPVAAFGP
ncbi:MAG TPA: kelch repeat-containing protein [Opitutaceae bacterium]|nr:kelch repeat-containing protein [Opitutaceae bacterium]